MSEVQESVDSCSDAERMAAKLNSSSAYGRIGRPTSLNAFAAEVHAANAHWWHDPATGERLDRNKGEMFMLMVSELAECMEGERKDLMDDHLPHRKMAEVELADFMIRAFDYAGANEWDLDSEFDGQELTDNLPANKGACLFAIVACLSKIGDSESDRICVAMYLAMSYAAKHGYDLWGAVAEKREYNKHRADHKPEARLAANGKKW